jgi:uncharacterized membrane protein
MNARMLDDYQPKPRALWIAALIFLAVTVVGAWFRWSTFQNGSMDLAHYTQSLWLATKGQWHVSLLDVPFMGYHAEPICFVLLPLFWLWPQPIFLIVIQALLLATMPFTAYRIARRLEFERSGALWMALATLLAPATGFIALSEFHPEALAAPLLLLMIEARQSRRPGSFWLFFLFALMCKENVALMLAWFCFVHWLLEGENGREWQMSFNVLPGAIALGWVAAYVFWLGPQWSSGKVNHFEQYSHLGATGGEIAGKVFTSPLQTWRAFWAGLTGGNLVWGLMVPFLLMPLLRPRWIIISAPIFLQHLLSWNPADWTIRHYYAAPLLPLLWMATAEAGANMFWRDVLARWVAIACVVCQGFMGPARSLVETVLGAREKLRAKELQVEMLSLIPAEGSAVAGIPYLAHLAKREQLHSLHFTLKGPQAASRAGYPSQLPDALFLNAADAVTFDRSSRSYHSGLKGADGQATRDSEIFLHRFLLQGSWRVYSKNAISVFLRAEPVPHEAPTNDGRKLDDFHTLAGLETMPAPAPGSLKLLFTWDLAKDRPMLPWVRLLLRAADGKEWQVDKGPAALGVEGGRFREEWLIAPDLPPGKYQGQILIYDNHEGQRGEGAAVFQGRRFDLPEVSL